MNPREKKLAIAVGLVVALWAANQGWEKYQAALKKNRNTQIQVAQDLSTAKTASLRGKRAQTKLRRWSEQSLPGDENLARSLYQDWLRQQLTAAGINVKSLETTTPRSRSQSYRQYSFDVAATGTLAQLTDFLYEFYQAKHLHRISQTTITSADKGNSLTISLTVDALSLPNTSREDELATGTIDRFEHSLADVKREITSRNIFAKPQAANPQVAKVEQPKQDNEAAQATFSGMHYGDSGWLMLVRMQNSGKVLYFQEGDEIRIGDFQAVVVQLDGDLRQAIVTSNSQRMQISFGKTLAEARPLNEPAS